MAIIATFVANTALNFVLSLLIARFLGPADYGRYAIAMGVALVINTIFLDWIRLSATRYYAPDVRGSDPSVRASLSGAQVVVSGAIVVAALLAIAGGLEFGIAAPLVAAAAAAGIATAAFDLNGALARALFLDRTYALLVVIKSVGGFVLMVGGAWWFRDPVIVIAGFCISVATAIAAAYPSLRDRQATFRRARRAHLASYLRYAVPLVAANGVYQLVPLLNRAAAASADGFAEAGHFALAADMSIRLFAALGSALDIYLFQAAVRTEREEGLEAAQGRIAHNMVVVLALLVPAAIGYALILPGFEQILVPAEFTGTFSAYTLILIPAMLAFAFMQYALSPVFQLTHATIPVMAAAAVGLAVDIVLLAVLPGRLGPMAYAYAQLGAYLASLLILSGLAMRRMRLRLDLRDLLAIALGAAAMVAVIVPVRGSLPPLVSVIVLPVAGIAVYGGIAAMLDLAGLRSLVRRRWRPA